VTQQSKFGDKGDNLVPLQGDCRIHHSFPTHSSNITIMLKLKVFNYQNGDLQEISLAPETMPRQECLIGRASSCNLVLDSLDVSRIHSQIKFEQSAYHYTDLGSANGSRINNTMIQPNQRCILKIGDLIQIGDFVLLTEGIETVPSGGETSIWKRVAGERLWTKGELSVRCVRIVDETPDVKTFTFAAEPPVQFDYKPGQFVTLDLLINSEVVSRSYSISSSPSRPHTLEITVKRVAAPTDSPNVPAGLVSNWLHDHLSVGDQIKLNGPFGKFTCLPHLPAKLLLISAGSGITPMMSMSRWIADRVATSDVVFFHCARTPRDVIFRQELELMASRLSHFRLAISTTQSCLGQPWLGFTGRLTEAMLQTIAPDWQERTVYVCGPDGFMESTKSLLERLNFPMQNYHEESFGAPKKAASVAVASVSAVSAVEAASALVSDTLKVVFAQSGKEVAADGSASILELAEQAGVKIRSSCKQGVCGACKKRKLSGEIKYESEPDGLDQSEQDAGYILACIAAPVGQVAIEA
jgi:ferredoxin-NADP reductase